MWDFSEVVDYSQYRPYVMAASTFRPRPATAEAPASFDWADQEAPSLLTKDRAR